MANTLLTLAKITRKSLQIFKNSNAFLQSVNRQYDDQFAVQGAKIGSNLNIRLTTDQIPGVGATVTPAPVTDKQLPITVATQRNQAFSFGAAELTLSVDDFADRYLESAVNNLAGAVAADVMGVVEGVPNLVHKVDGSNNTVSPTADTWLQAGAILDQMSCPRGRRKAIVDPLTSQRTITSMLGLFNPNTQLSKQFRAGTMDLSDGTLGINDWRMDQSTLKHVTAAYGTLGTVASVPTGGNSITTSALNGPLSAGDIITIANVHSVNRVMKTSNGTLMQFVVTANVVSGATSIPIYPALIAPVGGVNQPYQTVDVAPTSGAAIASPVNASETYRKNIVFDPLAFTLVTADLYLPKTGVVDAAREVYDGISMRMITDFITLTDQRITRLDILYGFAAVRPEWCVIVADAL